MKIVSPIKVLVFVVIGLFVSVSVIPIISGNIKKMDYLLPVEQIFKNESFVRNSGNNAYICSKYCRDSNGPLIVNHTSVSEFDQIPDYWIGQAKSNLHIAYQHTSHGGQLVTGMNALENFPSFGDKYEWSDDGSLGLDLDDYGIPGCADLSQGDWIDGNGVTPWVTATRNLLNDPVNLHINVIMWSWCSINGHNITRYLENMEILVGQYPNVDFIFMTGHAEGQGEGGFIHTVNEQIRQHCINNSRILFDFADIENYDPDEEYYYDKPMWDDLDYNPSQTNNWGEEWIDNNTGSELEQLTTGNGVNGYDGCGSCAHSDGPGNKARINCVLKGVGVWWMMAKLAGWNENIPPTAIFTHIPLFPTILDDIQFNDNSTDNDGFIINWSWSFGDGNNSYDPNPVHQYTYPGNYTVSLNVTDDDGATDSHSKLVPVGLDLMQVQSLSEGWNLVSLPFNQSLDKIDVIVKYDGYFYSWSDGIVNNFVFGWDRGIQSYNFASTLEPGNGYWFYAYEDCELWIESFGVPYNENVSKVDILVDDTDWDTAVGNGWISDFVFGWNRSDQHYDFSNTFVTGYAYWVYAYQPCTLKRTGT